MCRSDDVNCIQVLLTAGADANAKAGHGLTPLDLAYGKSRADKAEQTKWDDVIELLKRHGAQGGVAEDG